MSAQTDQNAPEAKAAGSAPAGPAGPAKESGKAPQLTVVGEAPAPKSRRGLRIGLMLALPLALAVGGGYLWLTGGRYASTDNAYLEQNRVTVTADQSGRIVEVAVHENDRVKKGDLLFRVDPESYEIALRQAEAAVAVARLEVDQLRSAYQEALAAEQSDADTYAYQQKVFDRQQDLLKRGVSSNADFDAAQNTLRNAQQTLAQAKEKVSSALSALGGDASIETDKHPAVMQALAAQASAALALKQTAVYAPADGIVSQTDRLHIGQYAPPRPRRRWR